MTIRLATAVASCVALAACSTTTMPEPTLYEPGKADAATSIAKSWTEPTAQAEIGEPTPDKQDPFKETAFLYVVDLDTDGPKERFSLLPDLFSYLPADATRSEVNRRAWQMLTLLGRRLPEGSGVLLRVRLLTNNVSSPAPPAEFLIPLAAGADPVDAYAEYVNLPLVRVQAPPAEYRDVGYLLWIENLGEGKLHVGAIPRAREQALAQAGTLLANRQVELRQAGTVYTRYPVPDYAERAGYWQERLRKAEADIADANRKAAIQSLVDRFAAAQREHTMILQQAADTKRRKSDLDSLIGALETIISVGKAITTNLPKLQAFLDKAALQKESGLRGDDIRRSEAEGRGVAETIKSLDGQLSQIPELRR